MVNISVNMDSIWTEHTQNEIKKIYLKAIEKLDQIEVLKFYKTEEIDIILTDNFLGEIEAISKQYNLKIQTTRDKEYWAAIKAITDPENTHHHIIIFNVLQVPLISNNPDDPLSFLFFFLVHQILMFNNESYLPRSFLKNYEFDLINFDQVYEFLLYNMIEAYFLFKKMKEIGVNYTDNTSVDNYIQAFQRKVRKSHYQYQTSENLFELNYSIIIAIKELFLRCIEANFWGGTFDITDKYQKIILEILKIVSELITNIEQIESYNLDKFIDQINRIFEFCFIKYSKIDTGKISINFLHNPKLLFRNEIIDTQDCFVAFVDILGFTNCIQEYETNEYSNVLKYLKIALDESIELSTRKIDELYAKSLIGTWGICKFEENVKLLEYRMFSDCFCFSIPYFNNKKDYIFQFSIIVLVLRVFQFKMLEKGFTIRGCLSFGSFYSDNNMLFSGGLVKAHNFEEKYSKMPRIIVDPEIITKFNGYNIILFDLLGLTNSLIIDKEFDDFSFINPFDLDKSIELNYSQFTENIESLYEFLNIDLSRYKELIDFTKLFTKIPFISNLPIPLHSPLDNNEVISENSYNKIVIFIKSFVEDKIAKFDSEEQHTDNEIKEHLNILGKYKWLNDLMLWTISDKENNSERFQFSLKHQVIK